MVSTYQLQEDYESSSEWYTLEVRQSEVPLYGSSRLGLHLTDRLIRRYYNDDDENGYDEWDATVPGLATGPITSHSREVGHKAYELSNHLGNVLATVSDRKWPVFSEPKPGKWQFEHFQAELLSASEYYPFGMEMPGRIASSESYRYGFQGQEKDDEIKGPGNSINYKYRMHDPRMGRFLSVDPLAPKYPWNSPYAFSENRVIDAVELEGLEKAGMHMGYVMKDPETEEVVSGWDAYNRTASDARPAIIVLAETGIGLTPLGVIIDIKDTKEAFEDGDDGDKFFAAVGWIPGGDLFKGFHKVFKFGKTVSRMEKRRRALEMVMGLMRVKKAELNALIGTLEKDIRETKGLIKELEEQLSRNGRLDAGETREYNIRKHKLSKDQVKLIEAQESRKAVIEEYNAAQKEFNKLPKSELSE